MIPNLENQAKNDRNQIFENRHGWVIEQGAKSAVGWGTVGLFASLFAQNRIPLYQRQSIPFKVFIGLMIPTAAFFTITDRAAMHADRIVALKYSITTEDELVPTQSSPRTFTDWLLKNRYTVLGYTWVATLGATLVYNFSRKDISTTYKFINSRMIAQTMALAGMGAMAFLAASQNFKKEEAKDLHFESVINQNNQKSS